MHIFVIIVLVVATADIAHSQQFTAEEKAHIRLHLQEMRDECNELRDADNDYRKRWAESHGMTRREVINYCTRLKNRIRRIRDLEEYPAWLKAERIHDLHDKLLEEER